MNTLILGLGAVCFLLGFVWLLVRISKSFEKEQAKGFKKKIVKDKYKGGLQWKQ